MLLTLKKLTFPTRIETPSVVDLRIISALKIRDLNLATKIGKFLTKNILAKVHRAGILVIGIKMLPTVLAVLTVGTAVLAEIGRNYNRRDNRKQVLTANGARAKLRKV
jgi:hypothetical protein